MKREIAMKWVKALRSGKYKQGKSALVSVKDGGNCFCCLGVLAVEVLRKTPNELFGWGALSDGFANTATLGTSWGSQRNGGNLTIGGESYASLAVANDFGASFKQIATYIEKNYKKL